MLSFWSTNFVGRNDGSDRYDEFTAFCLTLLHRAILRKANRAHNKYVNPRQGCQDFFLVCSSARSLLSPFGDIVLKRDFFSNTLFLERHGPPVCETIMLGA